MEGICKCEKCEKEFSWFKLGAINRKLHEIPKDKASVYKVCQTRIINGDQYPTEVVVRCLFCDHANRFKTEYYTEDK